MGSHPYWHLEPLRRVPSSYDIASSRLLYYPERGFEVNTPVAGWYARFQRGSRLRVRDWESFREPRETTYTRYVARQAERESFIDGLLRSIEGTSHDKDLDERWVALLEATLPVLRYPCHGLQMVVAYVAQLAPTGRVVIPGLFQAGDEMRRIYRFAYRMRQLQGTYPSFGLESKRAWLEHSAWQPLRKTVEQLLVTYDFGEALVALNMVLKPSFDHVFLSGLARLGDQRGDAILGKICFSLAEDARWHREWSSALVEHAVADSRENAMLVVEWMERWREPVRAALTPLRQLETSPSTFSQSVAEALNELDEAVASRKQAWRGHV